MKSDWSIYDDPSSLLWKLGTTGKATFNKTNLLSPLSTVTVIRNYESACERNHSCSPKFYSTNLMVLIDKNPNSVVYIRIPPGSVGDFSGE